MSTQEPTHAAEATTSTATDSSERKSPPEALRNPLLRPVGKHILPIIIGVKTNAQKEAEIASTV